MKKLAIRLALLIPFFYFSGCTPQVVSLQSIGVSSLDKKTPLHITDERAAHPLTLQAGISVNNRYSLKTQVDKHTMVNSEGIFEVEPVAGKEYKLERGNVNIHEFEGNNFSWNLPHVQASLNADFALSKYFSLYFGGSAAQINDKIYTGVNGGLGLAFESRTMGLRFDFGIDHYETSYEAQIVQYENKQLNENDTREVYFSNISASDFNTNFNFSVCLNTKNKDWLLNYFMNFSYGLHSFYDFTQTNDMKARTTFIGAEGSSSYSAIVKQYAAGIYKNIDANIRAIGGFRHTRHNDAKKNLQSFDTFIQFDFLLF